MYERGNGKIREMISNTKLADLFSNITLDHFLGEILKVDNTVMSSVIRSKDSVPSVEIHGLKGIRKHTQVVIKDDEGYKVCCLQIKIRRPEKDD